MQILTNHIGYDTNGPKQAVILGKAGDQVSSFKILEHETGAELLSGVPTWVGPVHKWKDWVFWTVDFSPVTKQAVCVIECSSDKAVVRSNPFVIQDYVLERNALSNVVAYFKSMRCAGLFDKADRQLFFEGDLTGKVLDAHGGWYDATADYGKHLSHLCFSTYFNPQQLPMVAWSLFKSYDELQAKGNPYFKQYLRRMLDEALFGADYLVRIKDPEGSFYITVSAPGVEKNPQDRRITPVMQWFGLAEPGKRDAYAATWKLSQNNRYETSFRSGAGVSIAVLARASTVPACGDFSNADYLKAAEDGFTFLEAHNPELTNNGQENIIDDYCALLAAVELYKATGKETHLAAADRRANRLMARLTNSPDFGTYWRADAGDRPFFHAADGGFPIVSLLEYAHIVEGEKKARVLAAVKQSLLAELALTSAVANPFGYSRQVVQNKAGLKRAAFFFPHDSETAPWWQGENARLGSMAAAAKLAAQYFQQDSSFYQQLQAFARDQLNWILGLNPYDACMLHGSGRRNPPYLFFGSYEYANLPGGIVNGITGGFWDEEDIDFQIPAAETGQDSDWRWTEQWLPHASWFLLGVAAR